MLTSPPMYNAESPPLFDLPDFPPLRRVKPLPKRRRTSSGNISHGNDIAIHPDSPHELRNDDLGLMAGQYSPATGGLPPYYLPIFNGVQDFLKAESTESRGSLDFHLGGGTVDEDDHGEGDYVDHLQHPGNTKKRKVPVAHNFSQTGHDPALGVPDDDPHVYDRHFVGASVGDAEPLTPPPSAPPPSFSLTNARRRLSRASLATLAGLQAKEMLKTRKRQLSAVLGAISQGDTHGLDQALSASYPLFLRGLDGKGVEPLPIRRSRRLARRITRRTLALTSTTPRLREEPESGFPSSDFAFVCHSATADRLIATRDEVAILHARFEAELARQSAKAAELAAKQSAYTTVEPSAARRPDRRTIGGSKPKSSSTLVKHERDATGQQNVVPNNESPILPSKTRVPKKKKRSAMANASNPHHLRNYVPSRVPHSGQAAPTGVQATQNAANSLGPAPLRFLSADIPARRRKKSGSDYAAANPIAQITAPADEWICPFCEYNLFYGDEQSYRRAIRSRKKILIRRRRARERASAAASGAGAAGATSSATDVRGGDADEDDFGSSGKHGSHATISKRDRDKSVGEGAGSYVPVV